jgi:nucleotide-binding universal stress UspA family protein
MLPFKRILFPVDFSAQSIGAARYVQAFAGRFDSELILLNVIELPHYNDLVPKSPAEKRARLRSFLASELEYFRVERISAEGDPAENILRIAHDKSVDLIMMPTHGLGAFRKFLLGSVAAKVLHDADCPVWTGSHLDAAPPLEKIELRRLLCAVKFEPHADIVLTCAKEFAAEYRAELTVLHATTPSANLEHGREKLRKLAGCDVQTIVEVGEAHQVVSDVARRLSADLLVIGRSPDPGVFGRLRTQAYPIIREAPCPVISV